jgi:hypothetical protein
MAESAEASEYDRGTHYLKRWGCVLISRQMYFFHTHIASRLGRTCSTVEEEVDVRIRIISNAF